VLVASRRPDNAIGWLMCLAAFASALADAGREYLAYGFLGGTAPGYLWIGWFTDALYFISMVTLPVILMLFPTGRVLSRRAGRLLALPIISVSFGTVGQLFISDNDVDVQGRTLTNPAGHLLPIWLSSTLINVAMLAFFAGVVAAVVVLVLRYRRSGTQVRQQTKWVVWAGSIGVVELVTELIPGNNVSQYTGPIASALISASVCVAILRYRLFDIDLVINRTLVYLLLSAGVVGLYVAVIAAVDVVVGEPVEIGSGLLAAAVVALAFGPARSRLQQGVDRLLYGERRNPYRVISQFGQRLEDARGADELAVVVQTVTQTLKLPYAAIVGQSGRTLAEHGTAAGPLVNVPLSYQGMPMGRLLVSPRRSQSAFDREEQQLLDDLARQIGAAVHAVQLSADLQASRTRLVNAKEEERRRLRRDLHDGLGPKLAALGLKVDAAHALADGRPEDSKQLMTTVKDDIRTTIEDIRRLVYDLRPPALDELGLVGALREAVGRFDGAAPVNPVMPVGSATAAPRISLTTPDRLPALPAAVEVAAYRIVTEALTNTVRHAHADNCAVEVSLSEDGATLHLRVDDDGAGLPSGWRLGVGTASMRERAEELGGHLTFQPGLDGRGTQVQAHLPCRSQP
jgi:signal transduction histidine kinase